MQHAGSPGAVLAEPFATGTPMARLCSFALRSASLAIKFASIFFMAGLLLPADFGMYGLLAAGVAYATYLVGADFYTFSNRELIRADDEQKGSILKRHAAAGVAAYLVVFPVVVTAFALGILPWFLLGWFIALLVVEHVGQECTRILVALERPVGAAVVLFLRAGLWPLLVVPLLWWKPAFRHLEPVLACWAASGVIALVVATWLIRRERLRGWRHRVDWAWIRRGFRVAAWFLVGSLALRALFTVDRFWMDLIETPDALAAYVFYMAIAGAVPALMEAGLFAFEYPSMVAKYPALPPAGRLRHARLLLFRAGIFSAALCVAITLMLPTALDLVGRPEYQGHQFFLVAGMVAMILYVMGLAPHFALYALGIDKTIVAGNTLALLLFFPAVFVLRRLLPVDDAIPAGLCVAFVFLLVWKILALLRISASPSHDMVGG